MFQHISRSIWSSLLIHKHSSQSKQVLVPNSSTIFFSFNAHKHNTTKQQRKQSTANQTKPKKPQSR
ncbi:hypothetical protein DsansV1_C08g0080421 [Dioscorea sansibarensis]